MTVTLTTTVGGSTANSYIDEAAASAYVNSFLTDRSARDAWVAALSDDRARALIRATQLIDSVVLWVGVKSTGTQSLAWPRAGAYDADGYLQSDESIPLAVQNAQAETAVWLLTKAGAVPSTNSAQFDSIKVGPITLNYNEATAGFKDEFLPMIIQPLIGALGNTAPPSAGGIRQVPVVRG